MTYQKNLAKANKYEKAMRFGLWLQKLPKKLMPPQYRVLEISTALWSARAVYLIAKLGVAEIIEDSSLSVERISEELNVNSASLDRLMRYLVSLDVFEVEGENKYRNNKLSNSLRENYPGNIKAMVLLHGAPEMVFPWLDSFEKGLAAGIPPFKLAHGLELFELLEENEKLNQCFSDAMSSVDAIAGDSFVDEFAWDRFGLIVDVGGSMGAKTEKILQKHSNIRAIVVDGASVIDRANQQWARRDDDVSKRITFSEGSLFDILPKPTHDNTVYLLSAVLHGMSDQEAIKALRNIRRNAAEQRFRIAILEQVLPETRQSSAALSIDLQMLMGTNGRERKLSEWNSLFRNSGYELVEHVKLASLASILLIE